MRLLIRHQWCELRMARGRLAALAIALALSIAAVVALAQAGQRLSLAMSANYLATSPAHAQLLLSPGVDLTKARALAAELARQEGIAAARLGITGSTRLRVVGSDQWRPAMLFELPDPGQGAVAHHRSASGSRPSDHELWIERDAARLLGGLGTVEWVDGQRWTITGQVHDPALAPASAEGIVYAYLQPGTLSGLHGITRQASMLLRFPGVEAERDQAGADAAARRAVAWLSDRGLDVVELRVPPLAEHPHQRQAESAVHMLLACAWLSAVLCAVTAVALLRGWLDGQRHALGVLKLLGASRRDLVSSNLALVVGLTGLAALAGALLGLGMSEALARVSAGLLNLELMRWRLSAAAVAAVLGLGLLPLVFTASLIWRWAAQPPAAALAERALQRPDGLSRLPLPGPLAVRLAVRNVLRRRRRFVLSSLLLGVAGAVFMGGLNLRAAWDHLLDRGAAHRLYQIELRLPEPLGSAELAPLLQSTPELRRAEAWNVLRATWINKTGLAVSRAYPDGGHGQLWLRQAPPDSALHRPALTAGRWLHSESEVVINQAAAALLDSPHQLGDVLRYSVGDRRQQGRLVGRIEEPLSPPTVYRLSPSGTPGTHWRLALASGSDPDAVGDRLVSRATTMGMKGVRFVTERDVRRASAGHLLVLQRALVWVALGTGVVGVVALASALGSSVAERKRELAVLHALGAPDRLLALCVAGEALLVLLFGVVLSLAFGGVLDPVLAARLGEISGQALPAHADGQALPLWVTLALAGGLVASAGASRAAVQRGRTC